MCWECLKTRLYCIKCHWVTTIVSTTSIKCDSFNKNTFIVPAVSHRTATCWSYFRQCSDVWRLVLFDYENKKSIDFDRFFGRKSRFRLFSMSIFHPKHFCILTWHTCKYHSCHGDNCEWSEQQCRLKSISLFTLHLKQTNCTENLKDTWRNHYLDIMFYFSGQNFDTI